MAEIEPGESVRDHMLRLVHESIDQSEIALQNLTAGEPVPYTLDQRLALLTRMIAFLQEAVVKLGGEIDRLSQ